MHCGEQGTDTAMLAEGWTQLCWTAAALALL